MAPSRRNLASKKAGKQPAQGMNSASNVLAIDGPSGANNGPPMNQIGYGLSQRTLEPVVPMFSGKLDDFRAWNTKSKLISIERAVVPFCGAKTLIRLIMKNCITTLLNVLI